MAKRIVVERKDKKWGWQLVADNGNIIATDGSQGYESEATCRSMADKVVGGLYKDAEKLVRKLPK